MRQVPSQIVPINGIEEVEWNWNEHPEEQIEQLDKSINDFGQFKNIILWHGKCIAGNGFLKTARERGETEIEIKDYSFLTEEQAKSLNVADNATPALSLPNLEKLESVLGSISIEIPGCTEEWLASIRGHQEEIVSDTNTTEAPEEFKEYGEDIETEYCCPKCGYAWSGKPR